MNIELVRRLAKALGPEIRLAGGDIPFYVYRRKEFAELTNFDPENDGDLFKRCLTELMNDGWDLNVYRPNDNRYSKSYSMESSTRNTADFKTLEEAVYTAFCEMKEAQR